MGRFKEIIIEAAAPYERGVQYGEQAREEITLCIRAGTRSTSRPWDGMSWEEARSRVTPIRQLLLKDYQDCLSEVEGIAKGSDTDFVDLMVLNARYEFLHFPTEGECTGLCAAAGIHCGRFGVCGPELG